MMDAIIRAVENICYYLLIGNILISWVPAMRQNWIGRTIYSITEPYMAFFRKFIPPLGMIDLSPILAFFALRFGFIGLKALLGIA